MAKKGKIQQILEDACEGAVGGATIGGAALGAGGLLLGPGGCLGGAMLGAGLGAAAGAAMYGLNAIVEAVGSDDSKGGGKS